MRAGAVAAAGIMPATGAKKMHRIKHYCSGQGLVRPVRPPAPMPAALST
jgi:hypothetical protein